ncbi:hypothetical protein BDV96DRAFT_614007 [Lophiotrema nucula]|uniref:Amidohydrolase-related domain-containing protein n=1 Tax=Lophiotrema nucula TaxID=690887 RepID=A0A6A5Z3V7_9PLEO|nr:hypothetical protein BDV96DRAFT_614007 [Lophiotrema nucula]
MNAHGIDVSVLSLGNPQLDFLENGDEAVHVAKRINSELQDLCSQYPARLFFLGCLPTTASLPAIHSCIQHLQTLPLHRGVVMGYRGFGNGLDDPSILPLFHTLADQKLPVLPVSLGFSTETTMAITRMYLAGIFDSVPGLQLILSHAGGMLPFSARRIERFVKRKSIWDVLRGNILLDGIVFDKIPLRAAADAVGVERVMFGTDHPLFPSLRKEGLYDICVKNRDAAEACFGKDASEYEGVMGANAVRILNLR